MKDLKDTLEKLLYINRFSSEYTTTSFQSRYGIRNKYNNLTSNGLVPFADSGEFVFCINAKRSYATSVCIVSLDASFLINIKTPPMMHLLLTDNSKRSVFFSTMESTIPSMFVSESFINTRLSSPNRIRELYNGEWVEPDADYRLLNEDEYFMHSLLKNIPPFSEFKYITESIERLPKFNDNNLNQNIEIAVNAKNGVSEGLYDINFNTESMNIFCDKMNESFDDFSKGFIILE